MCNNNNMEYIAQNNSSFSKAVSNTFLEKTNCNKDAEESDKSCKKENGQKFI